MKIPSADPSVKRMDYQRRPASTNRDCETAADTERQREHQSRTEQQNKRV